MWWTQLLKDSSENSKIFVISNSWLTSIMPCPVSKEEGEKDDN